MQEIQIEQAQPGMILGCRLRNAGGDVIAEAGVAITAKTISQCQSLGIYTLHVLGSPVPGAPQSYNSVERLQRISHLFRNQQQSIFMRTIEAFMKKHFYDRAQ